jgi:YgiT-type zinc finger domain-containing protein
MNEGYEGEGALSGTCGVCDAPGATTERMETDKFVYGSGTDEVTITVQVPVTWCSACGEGYTGEQAEIIRNEAVKRYLGTLNASR